jgi:hypothetical protein
LVLLVKKFISPLVIFSYLKSILPVAVLLNVIPPKLLLTNTILPDPNDLKFIVPEVVEFSILKLPERLNIPKFPLPPAILSILGSFPSYPILIVPAYATPVVEFVSCIYELAPLGL